VTRKRQPTFAAVDWGTTRLRVWLLDAGGQVVAEKRSDEGLLSVKDRAFEAVLERHLDELGAPSELPVIACGMAGSRQGWMEAPYVPVPALLDDVLSRAVPVPGVRRDVRIIPGAALKQPSRPDVMRGEETQLAGALATMRGGSMLVCMPGTHSKWVEIRDGVMADFSTWMTGEIFSVLSAHSILAQSIGRDPAPVNANTPAFTEWLAKGLRNPQDLTAKLFKIRSSSLLYDLPASDAPAALSGLLIGVEIASARRLYGNGQVVLIASGPLAALYQAALRQAGYSTTVIDADQAVRAGLAAAASLHFHALDRKIGA